MTEQNENELQTKIARLEEKLAKSEKAAKLLAIEVEKSKSDAAASAALGGAASGGASSLAPNNNYQDRPQFVPGDRLPGETRLDSVERRTAKAKGWYDYQAVVEKLGTETAKEEKFVPRKLVYKCNSPKVMLCRKWNEDECNLGPNHPPPPKKHDKKQPNRNPRGNEDNKGVQNVVHACSLCKLRYKRLVAHPILHCKVLDYLDTHYPLDGNVKIEPLNDNENDNEEPEEVAAAPPAAAPPKGPPNKRPKKTPAKLSS